MSNALVNLNLMLDDVDNLLSLHPAAKSPARGRPAGDLKPLLRSSVLLTYAAWEVFIEDGMVEVTNELTVGSSNPNGLPDSLRKFVAERNRDPWLLSADGWRSVIVNEVSDRVRGDGTNTFGMNTAGPKQVVELHRELLGEDFLGRCKWRNMPNAKVKAELSSLVHIRGQIAHTGKPPGDLNLTGAKSWKEYIKRLGAALDGHVTAWLAAR